MSLNRIITRNGFNLPAHQGEEHVKRKTETVIIPSSSAPAFGSYFVLDYREQNTSLLAATLQFNVSALTGTTVTRFVPAYFFFTRIEIVQNNNVIDTLYPGDQFLRNQLYCYDEDRVYKNMGAGLYNSTAQRVTLAGSATSYYLPLVSYFNQGNSIPVLDNAHNVQFRIYTDSLANITAPAGAPVATLNSVNLLAKVVRMSAEEASAKKLAISKRPQHHKFSELRYMPVTVQSGVSSASIVMTGITGRISHLLFTVRPSASLANDNAFAYTAISGFSLLDATSTNVTGGITISHSQAMSLLNRDWVLSSYTSEVALSGTNNNANVYMYSFANDPIDLMLSGQSSGHMNFLGSEQLQINFVSALAANVQVDIYAYQEAVVEVSANSVKKRNFV